MITIIVKKIAKLPSRQALSKFCTTGKIGVSELLKLHELGAIALTTAVKLKQAVSIDRSHGYTQSSR